MDNINLDITTYTLKELENLLKLQEPYTDEKIFVAKKKLEDNILKSNINSMKKEELLIFLDNINNKLTNNLVKVDAKNFNDVKQYDGNHFIIKNENNKYSSTLENNKQVNKSIIKRTYTIDSLFRQNYDNSNNESHNYTIQLPEIINKAITMSVSSIEIPLTYHNVSEELNNNVFKIEVYDIINDTNITNLSTMIELTTGLYEARSLSNVTRAASIETEINTQIKTSFQGLVKELKDITAVPIDISLATDLSNNLTFRTDLRAGFGLFQYDTSSNSSTVPDFFANYKIKINFDVNNDSARRFCSDNNFYQKLGWQLGFREKNTVLEQVSGTTKALAISRCICYINYPRYLYIAIEDFQSSSRNYFSIASDSIIAPNIIGRINILSLLEEKTAFRQAAAPGDFIYNQKFIREYFGPTDINKLKIQLLDEYGRPFTINNMDWSFILSFECFYN